MKKILILISLCCMTGLAMTAEQQAVFKTTKGLKTFRVSTIDNISRPGAGDTVMVATLNGRDAAIAAADIESLTYSEVPALSMDVADQTGMTVKGVVSCDGAPVAGVTVSDGLLVTTTDINGHYWLKSNKKCGFVMVSTPKGYSMKNNGLYPEFYKTLTAAATEVEQVNFELAEDPVTEYAVMYMADPQMGDRINDMNEFARKCTPELNKIAQGLKDRNLPVYVITLGDIAYDKYLNNTPRSNLNYIKNTLFPKLTVDHIYNCMGNHDNNPKVAGDWAATDLWRQEMGPTYYSLNIGDVHYIILDNIIYNNANIGDRDYTIGIDSDQLTWLKRDLALIDKNTPIVVCMHSPLFNRPKCENGKYAATSIRSGLSNLNNIINRFNNVTVFSGHLHSNNTAILNNVVEYNVVAASGDVWISNYYTSGHCVAGDGSWGGVYVSEVKGKGKDSYYMAYGNDRNMQFRAYDLNNCHISAAKYAPSSTKPELLETWHTANKTGYGDANYPGGVALKQNVVLLNVFNHDPRWKVEAYEGNTPLTVTHVAAKDPLFAISVACKKLNKDNTLASDYRVPTTSANFFEIQATSPTSTVTIKVTDQYGNVYTEEMVRPRDLSLDVYKQN